MTADASRRVVLRAAALTLLAAGAAGCTNGVLSAESAASSATSSTASLVPSSVAASTAAGSRTTRSSSTTSSAAAPSPAASTALGAPASAAPTPPGGPSVEIGTGPAGSQQVALTFHGGGDPATAQSILDIAAGRGAHLTVLAIGTWLEANPALAAAIVGGGHDLGNHTWSHPVLSDLGADDVREEITRCRDLLIQLTGSPGPFFRTSSGQHASAVILAEAGAAGYPLTLSYDIDPQDWTDPGAAAVRDGAAQAAGGSIVSLHFGHPGTVDALPGILDDLQARGLQAVSASTLLAG
jgi:peptidoglycan/xylan/chitin deacetylase (PgdA/CDA1 family)